MRTTRSIPPALVELDAARFDLLPCCGIRNPAHPGRIEKRRWLLQNRRLGLRAQALIAPDGGVCGYIEWAPGECAWRAVDAPGYLFIHCIWNPARRHQGKGYARLLLDACWNEARQSHAKGVAALVREGPWMAGHRLFAAAGFESAASAPPDYQLLVRKLDRHAPDPAFRRPDFDRNAARYEPGLTIVRCAQCPHIARAAAGISEVAASEFGWRPQIIELQNPRDAQDAPTPYAVFSVLLNGRLLADHPISRARFRNIMRQLPPALRYGN